MPLRKQMTIAVIESLWKSATVTARLPSLMPAAAALDSALSRAFSSQRAADRFPYCEQGVLYFEGVLYGITTKDLSRTGVGIYSPIALEVGAMAGLLLPDLRVRTVKVERCSGIAVRCFEVGVGFNDTLDPDPTANAF